MIVKGISESKFQSTVVFVHDISRKKDPLFKKRVFYVKHLSWLVLFELYC